MPDQLFSETDVETKIVEGEDGSIKIGETFYKDKDAAFKGKAEADKHIAITQAENKELRDELRSLKENQGTALQRLLEKVDSQQTKQGEDYRGDEDDGSYHSEITPDTVQIDPKAIQRLVQEQVKDNLSEYDQQRQEAVEAEKTTRNLAKIKEGLVEKCGSVEEAKIAWEAYTSGPKFDQEIYNMQVTKTPEALVEAIAPQTAVSFGNTNISSSGIPRSDGTGRGPKPRSYWSELMKKNSRQYYSVENQRQMKADLQALGRDRFFDI